MARRRSPGGTPNTSPRKQQSPKVARVPGVNAIDLRLNEGRTTLLEAFRGMFHLTLDSLCLTLFHLSCW